MLKMSKKVSSLLSNAKELIKEQCLEKALPVCEEILQIDPDNVIGLLFCTKCWMDLNIYPDKVKVALEKVLCLKPDNSEAIKGLRKFYERHGSMYVSDAVQFYKSIRERNQMTDADYTFVTKHLIWATSIQQCEVELMKSCLLYRIRQNDTSCLKTLAKIAIETIILNSSTEIFIVMEDVLRLFSESIEDDIIYTRNMKELVGNYLEKNDPQSFYGLMEQMNVKNVYSYALFAVLLKDQYFFDDCNKFIELSLFQFDKDSPIYRVQLEQFLKNTKVENLIHLGNSEKLDDYLTKLGNISKISCYNQCQLRILNFIHTSDGNDDIDYHNLPDHRKTICAICFKHQQLLDVDVVLSNLRQANITSFDWYLLSECFGRMGLKDAQLKCIEDGLNHRFVYYKHHVFMARMKSKENDYDVAAFHFIETLQKYLFPEILEELIELNIKTKNYDATIELMKELDDEIEKLPPIVLQKYIECLVPLNQITLAICIAQRIVKNYRIKGEYWQLLGDLYLKRENLNCALRTFQNAMQLLGETMELNTRVATVYGLSYRNSLEEKDFVKAIGYFDKSLAMEVTIDALRGKAELLYFHADVSLSRLILSVAVVDLQNIISIMMKHSDLCRSYGFYMILLGKAILLGLINGIDNLIDFNQLHAFLFSGFTEVCHATIAKRCFQQSIKKHPDSPEPYFCIGLLLLHQLNVGCSADERGKLKYSEIFDEAETNFKMALSLDVGMQQAWKYLGVLYLRHVGWSDRVVFDIQHCLSMALNTTKDTSNSGIIGDPEAAFLLGVLYVRENRSDLASEVFHRLQLDHPKSPIGHLGMYLAGSVDHTVDERTQIWRALGCYNFRDDDTTVAADSVHRLNTSIIGLFCENLCFLPSVIRGDVIVSGEDNFTVINSLKSALDTALNKHAAYTSWNCAVTAEEWVSVIQYGCFLGILRLLSGDDGGRKIIKTALVSEDVFNCTTTVTTDTCHEKLRCLMELERFVPNSGVTAPLNRLMQLMNISNVNTITTIISEASVEQCLLQSIISTIPDQKVLAEFVIPNSGLLRPDALLCLVSLLLTLGDRSLAKKMVTIVADGQIAAASMDDARFHRVHSRLVSMNEGTPVAGIQYLREMCTRQPYQMHRWLNLLEFGLENAVELAIDIKQLLFVTNRPWTMQPTDMERYASIIGRYASIVGSVVVTHQRHQVMQASMLFPDLCIKVINDNRGLLSK